MLEAHAFLPLVLILGISTTIKKHKQSDILKYTALKILLHWNCICEISCRKKAGAVMQPPQVVFFQLSFQSLPLQQENRRHTALLQRTSLEMLIWGIYSTSWIQRLLSIFKSFETRFRLYKSKC